MHAVFTVVTFDPAQGGEETAVQVLHDELIPQLKQAPGFVRGTWFGNDTEGHGLCLFETEEQARMAVQPVGSTMSGTTVVSSDAHRVHGEA
jgi:hypothetical protein